MREPIKIKKTEDMTIPHLINVINFQLIKGEFKKGLIKEHWIELLRRIDKISWDERLIEMHNPEFYKKYIKTGELQKRFEHKNGVPLDWELEDGFGSK